MENKEINYNLEISFTYKNKPYHRVMKIAEIQRNDKIEEVYNQNELLVIGFIQPILDEIPNKPETLILHNVEVKYKDVVVFKKDVYNVKYIPKKDRSDFIYS